MNANASLYIIAAAGGNPTAIRVLPRAQSSDWYAKQGGNLMNETAPLGVEQAGFLIPGENRFEMSGGEFCGNAARAAAMLLSRFTGAEEGVFQMSGYMGNVRSFVRWESDRIANVTCTFDRLPIEVRREQNADSELQIVDLGGIVHIVIEGVLPSDYEAQHRELTLRFGLSDRGAVGVCWVERSADRVTLHPVVWVRAIDSFFYETSCGSGSIAATSVMGASTITQPSGEVIEVKREGTQVSLQSRMEVIREE
jgi:diaminopimelate epimerase